MTSYIDSRDADEYVSCPYNPAHVMRASRLIYHIVKCAKNPASPELLTCPYNAKHRILPSLMSEHINCCEYMLPGVIGPVELEAYQSYANASKDTVEVEDLKSGASHDAVDWDEDVAPFTEEAHESRSTSSTINNQAITFDKPVMEEPVSAITSSNGLVHNDNEAYPHKVAVRRGRANYQSVIKSINLMKSRERGNRSEEERS